MRTQVGVHIGQWQRSYILAETDAPASYDAGTTLELYSEGDGGRRTILVDVEDEDWQAGRYRSGLFIYEPHDGDLRKWVQNRLVERLTKTHVPEEPPLIDWDRLNADILKAADTGPYAMGRVAAVVEKLKQAGYQIRLGGQPQQKGAQHGQSIPDGD